jgi:hypothetical protein
MRASEHSLRNVFVSGVLVGGPRRGDLGTPPPPVGNEAPTTGVDPHALTAFEAAAALQTSEFLRIGGTFVDTCGGRPCYAAGWSGP